MAKAKEQNPGHCMAY